MTDEKEKIDLSSFSSPPPAKSAEPTLDLSSGPQSGPPQSRGILDNAPDDGMLSSAAKGVGTTVIKGLSHTPGMFGDLREGAQYLGRRLMQGITGDTPEVQQARGEKMRKRAAEESGIVGKALDLIPSTDNLWSGQDVS